MCKEEKEFFFDSVINNEFCQIDAEAGVNAFFKKLQKLKEHFNKKDFSADEIIDLFQSILLATDQAREYANNFIYGCEGLKNKWAKDQVDQSCILGEMKKNKY